MAVVPWVWRSPNTARTGKENEVAREMIYQMNDFMPAILWMAQAGAKREIAKRRKPGWALRLATDVYGYVRRRR